MKRATLGGLLRELAMRADEEEEQRTTLARDLSMTSVGVYASGKLAAASATIARQRAEIRDLRARLKAVRDTEQFDGLSSAVLSPEEIRRRRATDLKNKNWRKP